MASLIMTVALLISGASPKTGGDATRGDPVQELEAMGSGETVDWERARGLWRKKKAGEDLSEEETTYLEMAREQRSEMKNKVQKKSESRVGEPSTILSDVRTLDATASDGRPVRGFYRVPSETGVFPAMVIVHGGLHQQSEEVLRTALTTGPVHKGFLDARFVTVVATFRSYRDAIQSEGPILDVLAVVEAAKELPEVDSASLVVFGGSGGGSIALEIARRTDLSAVVCGEPATVIFMGMMTDDKEGTRAKIMEDPHSFFNDHLKKHSLKKLEDIRCPVLVLHGDVHPLKITNGEIFFPLLKEAGVEFSVIWYQGQKHGFYFGHHTGSETAEKVIAETCEFVLPRLGSKSGGNGSDPLDPKRQ